MMEQPSSVNIKAMLFIILSMCMAGVKSLIEVQCQEGYFRCNSTTECVPQRLNCNNEEDCPDGSDEWNCADFFASQYFDHKYRKRPGAENDDCRSCNWNYTGGECKCRCGDVLCQHLGLDTVPRDLPVGHIDLLDLTGNSFEQLTSRTLFSVTAVNTLVLNHCGIKEVHPGVFYNITSLHSLHLGHNEFSTLPEDMFSPENDLKTLVLSYNKIRWLPNNIFVELSSLTELDLRQNLLDEISRPVLQPLGNLRILYLNGNRITKIDALSFPKLDQLSELSLADNKIIEIKPGAFKNLQALRNLYLSGNRLAKIVNGTFTNLNQLLALNLNDNGIIDLEFGAFSPVSNLTSLYLTQNNIKNLDRKVLQELTNLQYVYFDEFSLCWAARHVRVCDPKGDGISSQEHLLDSPVLRTSVWIMGIVACVGNVLVLLGRLLAREPNAVHSLYIRNLALSDLLMGVYLFLIAGADERYRDFYIDYEHSWRHSATCSFCGFLSTLSCESSVLILSLVTWDRLVSVTQPLARHQPSTKGAILHLVALWLIAAIVALAPLSGLAEHYFGDEFYGSNGVCLSLHIHDPFAKGWEYSAAMFVLVNTIALSFICYAYTRMLREIRYSGVALRSTQDSQERAVAKRFGVIVFTDCLCWVPIIVVKLAALSGIHISQGLYAWLAVLVLPINSALNPVLYTLTTKMFKQQIRKMISTCLYKRRVDGQNSGFDSALSLSLGTFPPGGSRRRLLTARVSTITRTQTTSGHFSSVKH